MAAAKYRIDLRGVQEEKQVYDRLEQALPLPPWFGRNLDAVYDVLTEYGSDWQIEIDGMDELEEPGADLESDLERGADSEQGSSPLSDFMHSFRMVLEDAAEDTEGMQLIYRRCPEEDI